ncbi:MAG TPA: hypothetical protein DD420_35265 [Streptomyces sp.]|nr:hypothetical protein [Streptomyces sp.]
MLGRAPPEQGAGQQELQDLPGVGAPGGIVGQNRDGGGQERAEYAQYEADERQNEHCHDGAFQQ